MRVEGNYRRSLRVLVLAASVLLIAPTMPASAAQARCDGGVGYVRGLGRACDLGNGLYQLESDLGTGRATHGSDPLRPSAQADASPAALDPTCVNDSSAYQVLVTYAHPVGTDLYSSRVGPIRDLVRTSTDRLNAEAAEFGGTARFRVSCDSGGVIVVNNRAISTPLNADFGDVVAALEAAGGVYADVKYKHWVWYEGTNTDGASGTGHVWYDDDLALGNLNNGNAPSPTYAVQWGRVGGTNFDSTTWIHELAHNMGAVQGTGAGVDPSPNSSGTGLHCNDGQDIMCYSDGGSLSAYNPGVCTDREHFDCNHNDYFRPEPVPAGNYLATHWNIGSCFNRYMTYSWCGGATPGSIALTGSSFNVNEGSGSLSVTLARAGGSAGSVGVTVTTSGGSATPGADFTSISTTATFGDGITSASVLVPIIDDLDAEPNETFTVALSSPTGGATLGSPSSSTATIVDNDSGGGLGARQPDGQVSKSSTGPFRGDDIVNGTGQLQTMGKNGRAFVQKTFYYRVQNDAVSGGSDPAIADDFVVVQGPDAPGLWTTYYFQGSDVTSAILNGLFVVPVPQGETRTIRAVLHFTESLARQSLRGVDVTATWTNPADPLDILSDTTRLQLRYR